MSTKTRIRHFDWLGANAIPAVGSADSGPWVSTIDAAAGSPTIGGVGGALELALDAQSEVQNLCVYWGDVLGLDIDEIIRVSFLAKLSAALPASVSAVIGMCAARNDDPDLVAASAWFKADGSNALVCESDDGTRDNDDIATAQTLDATFKRLTIDFSTGVQTVAPPGQSVGGKGALQFSADNAGGQHRRVADRQLFDMSGYAAGLQPIFQIQKTTGTAVGSLTIRDMDVEYRF